MKLAPMPPETICPACGQPLVSYRCNVIGCPNYCEPVEAPEKAKETK